MQSAFDECFESNNIPNYPDAVKSLMLQTINPSRNSAERKIAASIPFVGELAWIFRVGQTNEQRAKISMKIYKYSTRSA
jgi:hypothetical protein